MYDGRGGLLLRFDLNGVTKFTDRIFQLWGLSLLYMASEYMRNEIFFFIRVERIKCIWSSYMIIKLNDS